MFFPPDLILLTQVISKAWNSMQNDSHIQVHGALLWLVWGQYSTLIWAIGLQQFIIIMILWSNDYFLKSFVKHWIPKPCLLIACFGKQMIIKIVISWFSFEQIIIKGPVKGLSRFRFEGFVQKQLASAAHRVNTNPKYEGVCLYVKSIVKAWEIFSKCHLIRYVCFW